GVLVGGRDVGLVGPAQRSLLPASPKRRQVRLSELYEAWCGELSWAASFSWRADGREPTGGANYRRAHARPLASPVLPRAGKDGRIHQVGRVAQGEGAARADDVEAQAQRFEAAQAVTPSQG